jgi:hypothetical protein
MMVTEDEAIKKWCPMARVFTLGVTRSWQKEPQMKDDVVSVSHCISSGCMMWRWQIKNARESYGFCGLAGSAGLVAKCR